MARHNQAEIEVAESKYTAFVHELYEKLLDLNIPMSEVAVESAKLMKYRDDLLDLYGISVAPPPVAAPPLPRMHHDRGMVFGPAVAGQWRMMLQQVAARRAGKTTTKDDFSFEHAFQPEDKTYIATLTSAILENSPYLGESREVSKKAAEQAVCEAAMKAEFPTEFAQMKLLGDGPDRGIKRRLDNDPVFTTAKCKLGHVLALVLMRPLTKDDIVYTTEQGEEGYFSTVTIPYKGVKKYVGLPVATRKDAESSAAEACMEDLKIPIDAALAEHRARKLKKKEESAARLEEKQAAQKAAEEAK